MPYNESLEIPRLLQQAPVNVNIPPIPREWKPPQDSAPAVRNDHIPIELAPMRVEHIVEYHHNTVLHRTPPQPSTGELFSPAPHSPSNPHSLPRGENPDKSTNERGEQIIAGEDAVREKTTQDFCPAVLHRAPPRPSTPENRSNTPPGSPSNPHCSAGGEEPDKSTSEQGEQLLAGDDTPPLRGGEEADKRASEQDEQLLALAVRDALKDPKTPRKRPKARELTRDQRIEIRALRKIGWTYTQILLHPAFPFTHRQIQRACEGPPTPQKYKCGRKKRKNTDGSSA